MTRQITVQIETIVDRIDTTLTEDNGNPPITV